MSFSPHHAAPNVEQAVNNYVRGMNSSRYIPDTPEIFRRVAEENRVYIFNVGPWAHARELGSAGSARIPACPEGKDYSEPFVVPGVVQEPYPINEAECKMLQSDGMDFAMQVLGEGPHVPKSSSFRPYGVFVTRNAKPTREEIAEARQALQQKYVELVAEANEFFSKGARAEIVPEWHFVAARALRKTEAECAWLANTQAPAARDTCPGCGVIYNVGIVRHGCGWIFDHEKWNANQAPPAPQKGRSAN